MNTMNKMRPIHPGEILREEFLVPIGMSAHALAMALKVPAPRINDIVRERRSITPETALRLARYFGNTPQFWLNLQTSYDLKIAESEKGPKIMAEVQARVERQAEGEFSYSVAEASPEYAGKEPKMDLNRNREK
jgi:antitoxin HigA-1